MDKIEIGTFVNAQKMKRHWLIYYEWKRCKSENLIYECVGIRPIEDSLQAGEQFSTWIKNGYECLNG